MPITTVTLDWGDTLAANHGQPYSFAHARALDALQAELTDAGAELPADWARSCEKHLHGEWVDSANPAHNPEQKEFDMLGLFAAWTKGLAPGIDQAVIDAALDRFSATCIDTVCAFDGVTEALAALKERGLRLGILSHIPWHRSACEGWLQRRGWDKYFDFLSISSEVGFIKPHKAHYDDTLAQAGCPVEEILHVGDHPERDMRGGRAYGFHTCLRWTDGIYDPAVLADCDAEYTIAHVGELPVLIDHINGTQTI